MKQSPATSSEATASTRLRRPQLAVWGGLVITIAGGMSYFTYAAQFASLRDFPVLNLPRSSCWGRPWPASAAYKRSGRARASSARCRRPSDFCSLLESPGSSTPTFSASAPRFPNRSALRRRQRPHPGLPCPTITSGRFSSLITAARRSSCFSIAVSGDRSAVPNCKVCSHESRTFAAPTPRS